MLRPLPTVALLAVLGLVAGCSASEDTRGPSLPLQTDAAAEAPADAMPGDAGPEGGVEAGEDASQSDAVDEAPVADTAVEAPWPVEAGADAASDPGLELGPGVWLFPAQPLPGQLVTLQYKGALAASSNVSVHYGFNGWNAVSGPALGSKDDGSGNLDFFAEAPMAPGAGGGWEASLQVPSGARALHVVFYTEQGGQRTWDSAKGRDYNAGLPLVLHGPVLTWDGTVQPHDGVIVNFHTGWPCKGVVEFGTGGQLTQKVQESVASRGHHVRLSGLSPATTLSYRVSCGALTEPAVRTFRTAPAQSSQFRFLVLGDVQEAGESNRWKRTADFALQHHADAAFIVFSGDMPWNDKPGLWWTFFDQGRELLGSRVLVPAKGNHDVNLGDKAPGTTSFERWFALDNASGSETYYAVRYGTAAVLVLDSEFPADFVSATGAQSSWIAQRLQAPPVSDATWVFASWHAPSYNAGARHWSEQGAFRDITAPFDGKVDWVFSGHEHLYQRMRPLRYNGLIASSGHYGRGSSDGVGYLVVPPAAAWPETDLIAHTDPKAYYRDRLAYPVAAPTTDKVSSENGYVVVEVNGLTLKVQSWGVGGPGALLDPHLVDQVSYTR